MATEYRDCPGRPGYRVDSTGGVWSCVRYGRASRQYGLTEEWRRLKGFVGKNGYVAVSLRRKHCYAHTLVLEAFVGPRPEGMDSRHLNGNRTDNRPENLAWGTRKQNVQDMRDHGTMIIGEGKSNSVLTPGTVLAIRQLRSQGLSSSKIALYLGKKRGTVLNVIRETTWTHVTIPNLTRDGAPGRARARATASRGTTPKGGCDE